MAGGVEQLLRDGPRPLIVTTEVAERARRLFDQLSRRRLPVWLAPVLVALAPLLVDLLFWPFDLGSSWRGLGWAAIAAVLALALLQWSPWAWRQVQGLGRPLDRMLPPESKDEYLEAVARKLPLGRSHLLLCAAGAALPVAWSLLASRHLPTEALGPGYYLALALLGFLTADNVRWFMRVPAIFLHPLTGMTPLRVVMHSPAMTPAIREMGRLAARTAIRAAAGFFVFGLALLWVVLSAKAGREHGLSHAEWLAMLALLPLVGTAATVIYAIFVPQYWLSVVIENERNRVLDELALELPEQGPKELVEDAPAKTMALYDSVANAPTATSQGKVIFKRTLVVAGTLAPQVYAFATRLLDLPLPD